MRVIGTLALAGAGGDTQAPTVPQGLVVTAINAGRVDLTWNASTDNVGVDGYQIFRNGAPLTTTTQTNHSDITVQPSTLYAYSVAAYDAAGNVSGTSGESSTTTPANATPVWQAVPDQNLIVGDSYLLDLNTVCTDADEDTISYSIVSGTLPTGLALVGQAISGTPSVSGQVRTISVRATDPFVSIDTTIDYETFDVDVTAPPVPTGLAASAISSSQIDVSWDASTDAAGSANEFVSGTQDYRLYRDGSLRTTTAATSYSDTGLSGSTQYAYRVAARDVSLNESAQAAEVTATTHAPSAGFTAQSGFSVTASSFAHGQPMTITRSSGSWAARTYGANSQLYDTGAIAWLNGAARTPLAGLNAGDLVPINPSDGVWATYGQSAHRVRLASSSVRSAPNARTSTWLYNATGDPDQKCEVMEPVWPSAWGAHDTQTVYVSYWVWSKFAWPHHGGDFQGKMGRVGDGNNGGANFLYNGGCNTLNGNQEACGPLQQSGAWFRREYWIDLTNNVWDVYAGYRYQRQIETFGTTPGPREWRSTAAYNASSSPGGYLYTNGANNAPFTMSSAMALVATLGFDGQGSSTGVSHAGGEHDIANCYIDPYWPRFEVSDSPTWDLAPSAFGSSALGTPREVQGRWSRDSSAQCTVYINQGQFSSLSGKYLWYTDEFKTATLIGQFV
jgi:chitodextrinase